MYGINISHNIKERYGCEIVYIYVQLEDNYEFAKDFFNFKKDDSGENSFIKNIREYAKEHLQDKSGIAAAILVNGVIIGSLAIMSLLLPLNENEQDMVALTPPTKIEEKINDEGKERSIAPSQDVNEIANIPNLEEAKEVQNESKPVSNNNNNNVAKPQPEKPAPPINNKTMVKVRMASGQVLSIELEEYVVGVVGSEMPALFSNEALKAQAVAARTYALKKTASGKVLSATTEDQVYKTNAQLQAMWGGDYSKYYNKVKNAVYSTEGLALTYGGQYIDALYFSTSNGKTEEPSYVWNYSVPYLKSVDSSFDANTTAFKRTVNFSYDTISSKLGVSVNSGTEIKVLSRTAGDRVNNISIGGKTFTGNKVRQLLGLRSTDFDIELGSGSVNITTRGYGHGVGMSQYGANEMAKTGSTYSQILKHYYTGVNIIKK